MNTRNKTLLVISALLIFIFMGCEEKVLDKPPRDVFSDVDVWSDIELAKKFQNTIYTGLGFYATNTYIDLYDMYCDNAMVTEDLDIYYYNRGNLAPNQMGLIGPMWARKYQFIRKANIFLAKIDAFKENTALIEVLKGETKYIRARMYFDLVRLWGGVPLITKAFELTDDFDVARNSYEDCIDWIVSELDEAYDMVPDIRPSSELGRVTKGACLATKADVLLHANSKLHDPSSPINGPLHTYSKNTWQDCADAAKAVIDMPQYELQPVTTWQDYHKIFVTTNSEMIFGVVYHPTYGTGNSSSPSRQIVGPMAPLKDGGWGETGPLQGLVDEFEMANGKAIGDETSGYDPSPATIYNNRELRFYADILYQGSTWKTPVEFVHPGGAEVTTPPWTIPGYLLRKHMDENIDLWVSRGDYPWMFHRLAEMYLTYAEAQYELGDEPEARKYLNLIRNRVNLPAVNASGSQLFKAIQHERRIELVFENQRFFDVRRWMIADSTENKDAIGIVWKKLDGSGNLDPNGVLTYTFETFQERTWHQKMYYFPIPVGEMEKSNLEQNPGYN